MIRRSQFRESPLVPPSMVEGPSDLARGLADATGPAGRHASDRGAAARPVLLLLIGFIAAACVYIFFLEPWGHDTYFHLQRLQDIEHQARRGQVPAHFGENVARDRGLPTWIYYSQWVYWPAMPLRLLGVSPLVSLKILYGLFLVVTCVGSYRLLRLHADTNEAAFGTLLFVTSNYVIGEIFVRSAYAEFLSVAPMPLLLGATHRTLAGDRRYGTGLVVFASLMILFHPLSFMNAGCALAAYTAYVVIERQVPRRQIFSVAAFFALALALTAFYWLPAVIETRYVLGADGVPTPLNKTFLSVQRYFKFISITNLGFVLTLVVALVAGGLLLRRHPPSAAVRTAGWPLAAGIIVYVVLTLRISEPLYVAVPLLASNLWVWRVLFPLTLLVVVFVTVNFRVLPPWLRTSRMLAALGALAVLQATVVVVWDSARFVSIRRVELQEIEGHLAVGSQAMEGFGIDEYLPDPRILPRPPEECRQVRNLPPGGRYEMTFNVEARDAHACIAIPRYWNVRYAATIAGETMPVYASAAGEILLVPAGRTGQVNVRFTRPAYVTVAILISLGAAVLLLGQFGRARRVPPGARAPSGR